MANDNQIEFNVRVNKTGLSELAADLQKVDGGAADLAAGSNAAGAALDKLDSEAKGANASIDAVGKAAGRAGSELQDLRVAAEQNTSAIKAGLDAERSELNIRAEQLNAIRAEQQARLQAAQSRGDERGVIEAQNALRQTEAEQLRVTAQIKQAEAAAIEKATAARREALAAVGPLTAAQNDELRASQNQATALRVQAEAAEQAASRAAALGQAVAKSATDTDAARKALEEKTSAIRASLAVEQSEINIQQQLLASAKAEQQARLQAAQARGDQIAAAKAANAIAAIEADQSRLLAERLRAEANAIQAATDARREQLAAIGPLTEAQQQELTASENQAKALRVQAAAADTAAQQSRTLGQSFEQIEARGKNLNTTLSTVAKSLTGLFAAANLMEFAKDAINTADAYGQMAERIKMATSGTEEYERVQKRLFDSANITYRPLKEQQEMYIQTADALRSLSYTTEDVLDITDSFSYLLTTNAASAEKGRSAIDAYTKSIQSGRVESDAWQSIMAATPTIVDAIATATEKTASEVRNLGITGKLSISDLNEGLRQSVEINKRLAEGMSATVKDAVTRLANAWSKYTGETNEAHKGTQKIVDLINLLTSNLDGVVRAATAAGEVMVVVFAIKALGALKSYTAQLIVATRETQALMAASTAAGAAGTAMGAAFKAASQLAISAWAGWEIGTFLKEECEEVEKAGIAMAAGLTKSAAMAKGAWEMAKAVFTDDTIEAAQARMRKSLAEIDDEYAALFAAADRTARAQERQAASTTKATEAAQNATVRWENLRTAYADVNKEVEAMGALAEKTAALKNAEAATALAMAQAFGTEREQRMAAAQAAQTQAEQSLKLAEQKQLELEVMKAERDALLAARDLDVTKLSPERQKQLDDLQKSIALREAEAGAARAQATASKIAAVAAQAEANAHADNSKRVGELRHAYEQARQALDDVRAAKLAGKATTEQLTEAELAAGKAALAYKDALQDQKAAIEAKKNVATQEVGLQQTLVKLAMEQQQAIYEVAKARGDEKTAAAAQMELKRLEIELLTLTAQAKRAEADAALASIEVKRAELIATGEYNGVKRLELDAALKAAEAKRVEADIAEVTAQKLRDLASAQQQLKGDTDDATDSINKQSKALGNLNESKTSGPQFLWTQSTIVDYLKQSGLDESVATELSKQFLNAQGGVNYEASAAQLKWGGKYSTLAEALGKMTEYYKFGAGKVEYDDMLRRSKGDADVERPGAGKPPQSGEGGGKPPGGSGGSGGGGNGGNTYVNNITINGVGQWGAVKGTTTHTTAQSASTEERLLRELAEAKGVAQ